jgi:hypothetical protein
MAGVDTDAEVFAPPVSESLPDEQAASIRRVLDKPAIKNLFMVVPFSDRDGANRCGDARLTPAVLNGVETSCGEQMSVHGKSSAQRSSSQTFWSDSASDGDPAVPGCDVFQ